MEYSSKTVNELRNIARDRGMVGYRKLRKAVLIDAISRHEPAIVDEATKDVVDDVKVSVASVPAIETRVLVPKPSGLWSAIGSLYNKTKICNQHACFNQSINHEFYCKPTSKYISMH